MTTRFYAYAEDGRRVRVSVPDLHTDRDWRDAVRDLSALAAEAVRIAADQTATPDGFTDEEAAASLDQLRAASVLLDRAARAIPEDVVR